MKASDEIAETSGWRRPVMLPGQFADNLSCHPPRAAGRFLENGGHLPFNHNGSRARLRRLQVGRRAPK